MNVCSIPDCERKAIARGWCTTHYQRWQRHGDPEIAVRASHKTPEEAFSARTERSGDCLMWTGAKTPGGYGVLKSGASIVYAHRYAWERENGPIPEEMLIDHACHERACVNTCHLRLATSSQNAQNLRGANRAHRTTKTRNVYPDRRGGYRVQVRGKWGGSYSTVEKAQRVAEEMRDEMFGAFKGEG